MPKSDRVCCRFWVPPNDYLSSAAKERLTLQPRRVNGKETAVITKIHSTTIVVSDQEASLDFYVNKLGWEKRIDNMVSPDYRFLTVAPVGAETELVLGPAHIHSIAPGTSIVRPQPGMEGETGISLTVENVDETYQMLVNKGVRFAKPPEEMPWGGDKATWLLDPDGNSFFFIGR